MSPGRVKAAGAWGSKVSGKIYILHRKIDFSALKNFKLNSIK